MIRLLQVIAITLRKIVKFSLNRKEQENKLKPLVKKFGTVILFLVTFFTHFEWAAAQTPEIELNVPDSTLNQKPFIQDTTILDPKDSLISQVSDTVALKQPETGIESTINYSSEDSMRFSLDGKKVFLYGNAKIDYGEIKMEAAEIEIDWNKNLITARGIKDSTGNDIGQPIFFNGAETYTTTGMSYNYKSSRAYITGIVTEQGEGIVAGEEVYKNEHNELFSINNTYTTCNLEHPHYLIRSKKTKAIPGDKLISGPFYMEVNDVPTPLFFPFGLFPAQNESTSGLIIPSYGEEKLRGFFLKEGGYFFDVNEYFKVKLTGDIYSKGGFGLKLDVPYKKRYAYTGNFMFNYTKLKPSSKIEDTDDIRNDFVINWSHSPQSKGSSRFSASVNAATSTYNQNNNLSIEQNTTRKISSNISYSKTFRGTPFSMGLNARHSQDVTTNEVDLLLPDMSMNMENIYPFRKKNQPAKTWYQKLNLRWAMKGTNRINNNLGKIGTDVTQDSIAPFNFETLPVLFENSKKGIQHSIPLSTSVKFLKYLTLSPSMSYTERWYFKKLDWSYDSELDQPVSREIDGFNRVYDYSFSAGINTRIFGTYLFKKGRVKAIRHIMNPSVGFSMRPDFSEAQYDYYQTVVDPENPDNTFLKSRYDGFVYGTPGTGKSATLSFGVNNTLEMKKLSKRDTSNTVKKVPILNGFGFSSSYNFLADSFQLAPISFRANTSIFKKKVNLSMSGTLDPYVYVLNAPIYQDENGEDVIDQTKISQYAWNSGQGIGQLSRMSIAFSTSFNPKSREGQKSIEDKVNDSNFSEADKQAILNNPNAYVSFDIPWDLRLNYSLSYSKAGYLKAQITQALNFSGNMSLTQKWKLAFTSGYDFQNREFTQTNFSIIRDLHCWEMNLSWVPFGRFQSYNFTIRVKSSMLQDLKLSKQRNATANF